MLLDQQLHPQIAVQNGQLRAAARRREDSTSTITIMASPLSKINHVLFLCVWYMWGQIVK